MDDGERVSFDLNESLKYYNDNPNSVPCTDADPELLDAESEPETLSNAQINRILEPIIDSIAVNPDAIARPSNFDSLQCLLKYFPTIPTQAIGKVLDLIASGFSAEAEIANQDIEGEEQDTLKDHRELLEMYGFLLRWAVTALESRAADKATTTAAPVGRKGKGKGKAAAASGSWDSTTHLIVSLETMCKVLKLKLIRVFVTTSERDTFVSLFTKPVYIVLESEQRAKVTNVRMHLFKVLCIAVKHHGHAFGAQTSIVQNLTYFEHLSEPMAEFLQILSEQYDYPQLVDEILRELSNKEFNSNDTRGPKSVSGFISKLSELAPRLVIKQMTLLIKLLDSESYNLRCAVIDVCGNLIVDLAKEEDERGDSNKAQMEAFFDVLEERFLDVNPYCRCKAIQVYTNKILELEKKFNKRRQKVANLAVRSLEDKSSNVRRNAIKLLTKLITAHPYNLHHGGILTLTLWKTGLQVATANLDALKPAIENPPVSQEAGNETVESNLYDEETMIEGEEGAEGGESRKSPPPPPPPEVPEVDNSDEIIRLNLTRRYYVEAVRFIEVIHEASEHVCQLLSSKNKSEVVEAMDFFKVLHTYKVEKANDGIRRMLRLIWTKGNSDEGKGIQSHLIDIYKALFFDAPHGFNANEAATYIARNMISLTQGDVTPAELTSLEQLLSRMMKEGHVSDLVIHKLWQIYGVQNRSISRKQRRGSIAVLGMLSLADPDIVVRQLETILRTGLGPLGRSDLVLARYSCAALRHISPSGRKAKDTHTAMTKLTNDHAILVRLAALVELQTESQEWFGVAEQAISAIYALSKHPDVLCTEVIRRKTKAVFSQQENSGPEPEQEPEPAPADEDVDMMDIDEAPSSPPAQTPAAIHEQEEPKKGGSSFPLSQLLFIVGHVAVKQIVHLELIELEFKRRKGEAEKNKEASPQKKGEEPDDLDLIGGTTEDDFTEAMGMIRERELLYGENSILSNFGPLCAEICANNISYKDRTLQAQSALCMAKLMCVSSEYCESNLPLLITVLEYSVDPITRSNAVIALGDMAVCFNHLIDENTDFLYRRLRDRDASVKRTCLMTLTFLILAGQVKVKGQLGEMAKCLEDSDKRIADLSKMFFSELATKDNAVYNHFVDMFSLLSAEKDLSEEAFKKIIKFLATFIEKDKHAKQLADKLAARLPRCDTERQWNDVAYALSLLPHKNEEIAKTLTTGFRVVQASA
ncbi:armadillo-type protein [Tuber borchii]|uniref:Condensin complex subunit 1 n=1 Tax=Tuber borchii TaxID=42251 RepID=A0A2T7A1G8_TUBBO|nr:armadillo-type protein [Tuber borchii]